MSQGASAYEPDDANGYVVEIYMPKKLGYVSETFEILKEELQGALERRTEWPLLYGFSVYEVDGCFLDHESNSIMEDRNLVIRVFFDRRELTDPENYPDDRKGTPLSRLRGKVMRIMDELAIVSQGREKELWSFRSTAFVYKLIRRQERVEET